MRKKIKTETTDRVIHPILQKVKDASKIPSGQAIKKMIGKETKVMLLLFIP